MRDAGSLGGGSSKSRSGSREELGSGISVGTITREGRVMRVEGKGGFVRFVFKGRVCRAVVVMKLVCLQR